MMEKKKILLGGGECLMLCRERGLMNTGRGGRPKGGALCVECPAGSIAGLSPVAPLPPPRSLPSVETGLVMPNIFLFCFYCCPVWGEGHLRGGLEADSSPRLLWFLFFGKPFLFKNSLYFAFGLPPPRPRFLRVCVCLAASSSHLLFHGSAQWEVVV